jgi:hypothetical protein
MVQPKRMKKSSRDSFVTFGRSGNLERTSTMHLLINSFPDPAGGSFFSALVNLMRCEKSK